MPGNQLIDAYLARLAGRLPADALDELADGLTETYRHHLANAADPRTAARRALREFGSVEEIATAFTIQSPGRRAARMLLATGPAVGAAWATALVLGHAWHWPVPGPARLVFGLLLLLVVAALATAAAGRSHYARTRAAVIAGGVGLLALDGAVLVSGVLAAPAVAWPLAAAACASLARIGFTLRTIPRIISS